MTAALDRLEALAAELEASNAHGPWEWMGGYPQRITNPAAVLIADCFENPDMPSRIAAFIAAADPATVAALIAVARAAERLADAPFGSLVVRDFYALREALAALEGLP